MPADDTPAPAFPSPLAVVCHDAGALRLMLPWLAARPTLRLRACLQCSAHAEQLVVATDWQTVSQQLESPCLVLATPQCRRAGDGRKRR